MIIRHGEKPEDGVPEPGLDQNGAVDDASLTADGWRRARKLVGFFRDPDAAGIETPGTIFACNPDAHSKRPMQTVAPLAAALWPDAQTRSAHFNTAVGRDEVEGLAEAVNAVDGVCLVAWEHHRIPEIATFFPHLPVTPSKWPGHRFDVVWLLTLNGRAYAFSQTPENLLPDDKNKPIKDTDA